MNGKEANIRRVTPYVPGEQPSGDVVKLNTNENPYPPAPGVQAALDALQAQDFRKYPDPASKELTAALAKQEQVGADQIFVGVGSDEVLSLCFLTFFNSGKPILFPDITYSFYPVWADLYRIPYVCPKLDDAFRIRKEEYRQENGGVIFPNPNAPTGLYEDLDLVEEILKENRDVVVIVDEAYIDFAGPSAVSLLHTYDNLVVVKTFSKSRSLAGLRVGYAISSPDLIQSLTDVKYSFNSYTLNTPAQVCALAALEDPAYAREKIEAIKATREEAKQRLKDLGFVCLDSQANFLFVRHPKVSAYDLFTALKEAGIYVRHFDSQRVRDYLRITVGTRAEMETLFSFLTEYLA